MKYQNYIIMNGLLYKEISNIFRISEIRTYKIYRKAMQDLKDIFIKKEIFK